MIQLLTNNFRSSLCVQLPEHLNNMLAPQGYCKKSKMVAGTHNSTTAPFLSALCHYRKGAKSAENFSSICLAFRCILTSAFDSNKK